MRAQCILKTGGHLPEPSSIPAEDRSERLGRVARPLREDPSAMELVVSRLRAQLTTRFFERSPPLFHQRAEGDVRGSRRIRQARISGEGDRGVSHRGEASSAHRAGELVVRLVAIVLERGDEAAGRLAIVGWHLPHPGAQVLEEDVGVSHPAEHAAQPPKLGPNSRDRSLGQERLQRRQTGAEAPNGDASLVNRLRVVPGSRSILMR
jgi:hypothetical protein